MNTDWRAGLGYTVFCGSKCGSHGTGCYDYGVLGCAAVEVFSTEWSSGWSCHFQLLVTAMTMRTKRQHATQRVFLITIVEVCLVSVWHLWFLAGVGIYLFLTIYTAAVGLTHSPALCIRWAVSMKTNLEQHDTKHSLSHSAETKNMWNLHTASYIHGWQYM